MSSLDIRVSGMPPRATSALVHEISARILPLGLRDALCANTSG
ncbi:hypothetical protein [Mycobacterium sp. 852002-10029_SCH5224772]|nr:hypothetical protein [Mycobacterium sp. 852002-10029_SCH5224772]